MFTLTVNDDNSVVVAHDAPTFKPLPPKALFLLGALAYAQSPKASTELITVFVELGEAQDMEQEQ